MCTPPEGIIALSDFVECAASEVPRKEGEEGVWTHEGVCNGVLGTGAVFELRPRDPAKRVFYFVAADERERDTWIRDINEVSVSRAGAACASC